MVEALQGWAILLDDLDYRQLTGGPKEFIEGIDGIDNGVPQYPADISPKYRNRTDLSSRVGWLNSAWNQPVDSKTVDVRSGLDRLRFASVDHLARRPNS